MEKEITLPCSSRSKVEEVIILLINEREREREREREKERENDICLFIYLVCRIPEFLSIHLSSLH
jgi:hypothetical protein